MARSAFQSLRVRSWLKILLPLAALALLSTLFLFSKSAQVTSDLPFTERELEERIQKQVITAPFYAGTTPNGAAITLTADRARPDPENDGRATAEGVRSMLRMADGSTVLMQSDEASLDDPLDTATLRGNVTIESSAGYVVRTDAVTSALNSVQAETDGAVTAHGPPGRISAGKMVLSKNPDGKSAQMLFTGGVKLIYDPRE